MISVLKTLDSFLSLHSDEIVSRENSEVCAMHLYDMGGWWVAFDRSAYLLSRLYRIVSFARRQKPFHARPEPHSPQVAPCRPHSAEGHGDHSEHFRQLYHLERGDGRKYRIHVDVCVRHPVVDNFAAANQPLHQGKAIEKRRFLNEKSPIFGPKNADFRQEIADFWVKKRRFLGRKSPNFV